MARTKQAARKSTGGKQPRNQILSTIFMGKKDLIMQAARKTESMGVITTVSGLIKFQRTVKFYF